LIPEGCKKPRRFIFALRRRFFKNLKIKSSGRMIRPDEIKGKKMKILKNINEHQTVLNKTDRPSRLFAFCLSLSGIMILAMIIAFPLTQARADILRIGLKVKDMDTLDPHFASEPRDRAVAEMIFNRLIRYKPGNINALEPDLAVSIPEPEISAGRQVWQFELRKGVLFQPGLETGPYELTADDVVWSLKRAAESVNPIYAGDYSGMSVEKVDDYSIRIIFEKPLSSTLIVPRLATYAGGFIMSKKAFEAMKYEDFKVRPVGTGPFRVEKLYPGKRIRLRPNIRYFRENPLLDSVEILFLPELKDRESALERGKADIIEGEQDTEWIEKMEQYPDVRVDVQGIGEVAMIHFNTAAAPLNDVRVRRAIAYALDRDVFTAQFGSRVVEDVYSPVPTDLMTGGMRKEKVKILGLDYPKNLEKARKLMAEAGYAEGFPLELITSEMPNYLKYYESMRDQLAEIGIECTLKPVNHGFMHMQIREDKNPLVVYIAWRPDADATLSRFFHSDAIVMRVDARPDTNFSHYTKVDKLIEAARLETNTDEQIKLWRYAQIRILDDMAVYPVHYMKPVYVYRKYVDYGYEVVTPLALYPQITEKTRIGK
jgi:peptide/nickel transport system substrate-binding protein